MGAFSQSCLAVIDSKASPQRGFMHIATRKGSKRKCKGEERQTAKLRGVPQKGVKSDQSVVSKFWSSLLYLDLKYLHIITHQRSKRRLKSTDVPVIRHMGGTAILHSLYLKTTHLDCTWDLSLGRMMKSYLNSLNILQNSGKAETFGIRIPVSHRETCPSFFLSCYCYFSD